MYKKTKIFFLAIIFLSFSTSAMAWDDCPYGLINDPYPGECARYIDTNNNQICDKSEPDPLKDSSTVALVEQTETEVHDLITGQELKTKTVNEIAEIYQIDSKEYAAALSDYYKAEIKQENDFQILHDNHGVEPNKAKEIAQDLKNKVTTLPKTTNTIEKSYHLGLISITLIILYILTLWLSKIKKITLVNHRKFWNFLLLVSFLASAILGILLVIRINFQIVIPLPFSMLFWHVEAGIAMAVISVFHILWHWAYFKNYFKIRV